MEIAKPMTPEKSSTPTTHNNGYHYAENLNPNVSDRSPVSTKSSNKSQKSISKNPIKNPFALRQRKFVVAKKNNTQNKNDPVSCKCKDKDTTNNGKCPCVAYQNLRASQEDFFKKREEEDDEEDVEEEEEEAESVVIEENEELEGSGVVKRRRERVLEEARNSVPENGAGRVMHLVKAFEKLLSIPNSKKKEEHDDDNGGESNSSNNNVDNKKKRVMKWALPGLQLNHQKHEAEVAASDATNDSNSSLFCASDLVLTSQNLGLDQTVSISSSWDSSRASCSVSSRTSSGGRRSRRNSLESSGTIGGRRWKKKKQLKVTSQKPFKLRTEQRGKLKEEEFMNKIQQMMTEEEKLRIPIAQGLPWTTDEPECLVKPPVKESTKPIDLKLHSDVRAVDRAEFDHQVAEKMSLMEQYRLERERQQKLAEEEEIRRLRKELIPKAQPMPYFNRPFVPRRSMKHPTIPKEPKFHIPQHKKIKCCSSWNDMSPYFSYLK